jgi:hypothetical protein
VALAEIHPDQCIATLFGTCHGSWLARKSE